MSNRTRPPLREQSQPLLGEHTDITGSVVILTYLSKTHEANPEAEVSGPELQHALGLSTETVRSCVTEFARQGLVEFDPLLSNIWLRITDKGLALVARGL